MVPRAFTLLVASALVVTAAASGTTVLHRNLGELIALADVIVVAEVVEVEDGVEAGLPATRVVLQVEEGIRGAQPGRFTFRQFGLLRPRTLPDGRVRHLISPPGWPRFAVGEKVLLFLYRPSALSGLRTTVGLEQGTFRIEGDRASNPLQNRGLLRDMVLPAGADVRALERLRRSAPGALAAQDLLRFVRRAVADGWFP